jgi:hypothetical protein
MGHIQTAAVGAAQPGQVGTATQRLADVLGQGADVGALAAAHRQLQGAGRSIPAQDVDGVNAHLARLTFHLDPGAGVFVQRLAVLLQGGVHRRHLGDQAGEARAGGLDGGHRHLDRALADDLALHVAAHRVWPRRRVAA